MLGVELGEVDVPAVPVLLRLPQVDSKLTVVLERLNLLVVDGQVCIGVHALVDHAQLGGHHPLLLVVLLLHQVSLLVGISASELVHHG